MNGKCTSIPFNSIVVGGVLLFLPFMLVWFLADDLEDDAAPPPPTTLNGLFLFAVLNILLDHSYSRRHQQTSIGTPLTTLY